MQKKHRKFSFFELVSKIFNDSKTSNNDYLMPWGQDLVDSGEYETYHFEEEEMEEDDFYYEDD